MSTWRHLPHEFCNFRVAQNDHVRFTVEPRTSMRGRSWFRVVAKTPCGMAWKCATGHCSKGVAIIGATEIGGVDGSVCRAEWVKAHTWDRDGDVHMGAVLQDALQAWHPQTDVLQTSLDARAAEHLHLASMRDCSGSLLETPGTEGGEPRNAKNASLQQNTRHGPQGRLFRCLSPLWLDRVHVSRLHHSSATVLRALAWLQSQEAEEPPQEVTEVVRGRSGRPTEWTALTVRTESPVPPGGSVSVVFKFRCIPQVGGWRPTARRRYLSRMFLSGGAP